MALTLTVPPAASKLGPGITVNIHSSLVGALANDDIYGIEIYTAGVTGNYYTSAWKYAAGLHTQSLIIGADSTDVLQAGGLYDHDIAAGAGVSAVIYLVHHNLTTVDGPATINGYFWDPTSALYNLLTPGVTNLAAILSAVRKTF